MCVLYHRQWSFPGFPGSEYIVIDHERFDEQTRFEWVKDDEKLDPGPVEQLPPGLSPRCNPSISNWEQFDMLEFTVVLFTLGPGPS